MRFLFTKIKIIQFSFVQNKFISSFVFKKEFFLKRITQQKKIIHPNVWLYFWHNFFIFFYIIYSFFVFFSIFGIIPQHYPTNRKKFFDFLWKTMKNQKNVRNQENIYPLHFHQFFVFEKMKIIRSQLGLFFLFSKFFLCFLWGILKYNTKKNLLFQN